MFELSFLRTECCAGVWCTEGPLEPISCSEVSECEQDNTAGKQLRTANSGRGGIGGGGGQSGSQSFLDKVDAEESKKEASESQSESKKEGSESSSKSQKTSKEPTCENYPNPIIWSGGGLPSGADR